MPRIEVLTFEGCPHAEAALELVRDVVAQLAPGEPVEEVRVETDEDERRERLLGSPSVRIDGRDLEDRVATEPALACHHQDGAGLPPRWLVEVALLRALRSRHVLFLCVANSARSQLAEGIARTLAPEGVRISSAGLAPTSVRPEAVEVLRELGIDISNHRSKSVSEIDAASVDTVITLCADEAFPLFPGTVHRLHWALPDPAKVQGSPEQRLEAFRRVRDELRVRLERLFAEA
ncbi:MAG: arsenate reductase ArsC [Myxococcales bacterium]|jgi:arsenate reductase